MLAKGLKSIMVVVFSLSIIFFSNIANAQHETGSEVTEKGTPIEHEEKFDAARIIMEHVMDNHEFHLAELGGHPVSIPLPVILYSPQRGFDAFMSSRFEHGHSIYRGYKLENNKILPVSEAGSVDESVKVLDLSLTRNVVQMFIAALLLSVLMMNIAKKYKMHGSRKAPSGFQNAI